VPTTRKLSSSTETRHQQPPVAFCRFLSLRMAFAGITTRCSGVAPRTSATASLISVSVMIFVAASPLSVVSLSASDPRRLSEASAEAEAGFESMGAAPSSPSPPAPGVRASSQEARKQCDK
jgi:hypothetical protein